MSTLTTRVAGKKLIFTTASPDRMTAAMCGILSDAPHITEQQETVLLYALDHCGYVCDVCFKEFWKEPLRGQENGFLDRGVYCSERCFQRAVEAGL